MKSPQETSAATSSAMSAVPASGLGYLHEDIFPGFINGQIGRISNGEAFRSRGELLIPEIEREGALCSSADVAWKLDRGGEREGMLGAQSHAGSYTARHEEQRAPARGLQVPQRKLRSRC